MNGAPNLGSLGSDGACVLRLIVMSEHNATAVNGICRPIDPRASARQPIAYAAPSP